MDLEITTAAALRGHSRGHSSPEKITALPSNQTVNTSIKLINTSVELIDTSIELMKPLHSFSCMQSSQHLILCSFHPKLLRNHLLSCYKRSSSYQSFTCIHLHPLASPAFIAIVSSEDKELTLYKSSLVIRVSPTGLRA